MGQVESGLVLLWPRRGLAGVVQITGVAVCGFLRRFAGVCG